MNKRKRKLRKIQSYKIPIVLPIKTPRSDFKSHRHIFKNQHLKGGKLKSSTGLSGASLGLLGASAIFPEFAPVLLPASGISAGLGRVFQAFGKGISKKDLKKVKKKKRKRKRKKKR